jgi:hypothetical protein
MKNKKAIELSVNFLVIVILSIAMLGMGLYLVRTFFKGAEETKSQLDEQTREKIVEMLSYGENTAMPFNQKSIYAGESATYGVGVLNIDPKNTQTFKVEIKADKAYDFENKPITPDRGYSFTLGVEKDWLLYDEEPFTLKAHEQKEILALVTVPKVVVRGNYVFNVSISSCPTASCTPNSRYGFHKMYVTVP